MPHPWPAQLLPLLLQKIRGRHLEKGREFVRRNLSEQTCRPTPHWTFHKHSSHFLPLGQGRWLHSQPRAVLGKVGWPWLRTNDLQCGRELIACFKYWWVWVWDCEVKLDEWGASHGLLWIPGRCLLLCHWLSPTPSPGIKAKWKSEQRGKWSSNYSGNQM